MRLARLAWRAEIEPRADLIPGRLVQINSQRFASELQMIAPAAWTKYGGSHARLIDYPRERLASRPATAPRQIGRETKA